VPFTPTDILGRQLAAGPLLITSQTRPRSAITSWPVPIHPTQLPRAPRAPTLLQLTKGCLGAECSHPRIVHRGPFPIPPRRSDFLSPGWETLTKCRTVSVLNISMMAKLKAPLVDSLLSTHFHESPTTRIIDECAKVVRATPSAPLDHVSKRDSSIPEAGVGR
jgi:hypothetical protein